MCAGCSIKEERADLENGQFYCKEKGEIVYGRTDATNCNSFDWKNVVFPNQNNKK
jgi:hypothetical protein